MCRKARTVPHNQLSALQRSYCKYLSAARTDCCFSLLCTGMHMYRHVYAYDVFQAAVHRVLCIHWLLRSRDPVLNNTLLPQLVVVSNLFDGRSRSPSASKRIWPASASQSLVVASCALSRAIVGSLHINPADNHCLSFCK